MLVIVRINIQVKKLVFAGFCASFYYSCEMSVFDNLEQESLSPNFTGLYDLPASLQVDVVIKVTREQAITLLRYSGIGFKHKTALFVPLNGKMLMLLPEESTEDDELQGLGSLWAK